MAFDRFIDFQLDGFDTVAARKSGPLLVLFWQTDCESCLLALEYCDRISRAFESACVIGVAQDSREKVARCTLGRDVQFGQLIDRDHKVSRNLAIDVIPTYILTDREGKIIESGISWDMDRVESVTRKVAKLTGVSCQSMWMEPDRVPHYKPG
jgi:hypothetical protein